MDILPDTIKRQERSVKCFVPYACICVCYRDLQYNYSTQACMPNAWFCTVET